MDYWHHQRLSGQGQSSGNTLSSYMHVRIISFTGSIRNAGPYKSSLRDPGLYKDVLKLGVNRSRYNSRNRGSRRTTKGAESGIRFQELLSSMTTDPISAQESVKQRALGTYRNLASARHCGDLTKYGIKSRTTSRQHTVWDCAQVYRGSKEE